MNICICLRVGIRVMMYIYIPVMAINEGRFLARIAY